MKLFDTAKQEIVEFAPNPTVLMYTCGITPYDATHLGHAFTFISYDVLQRRLIDMGHQVKCVRNVTDVDDPLFAKARELGVHYLDLAAGEEARARHAEGSLLRQRRQSPAALGRAEHASSAGLLSGC